MIKKSLTFGPKKITLKLIYGRFPLGGAEKPPPMSNGVKKSWYKKLQWIRILWIYIDNVNKIMYGLVHTK